MGTTTSNYGFPIPDADGDDIGDVPAVVRSLGSAVDAALNSEAVARAALISSSGGSTVVGPAGAFALDGNGNLSLGSGLGLGNEANAGQGQLTLNESRSRRSVAQIFGTKDQSDRGGAHWVIYADADGEVVGDDTFAIWGYPTDPSGAAHGNFQFIRLFFTNGKTSTPSAEAQFTVPVLDSTGGQFYSPGNPGPAYSPNNPDPTPKDIFWARTGTGTTPDQSGGGGSVVITIGTVTPSVSGLLSVDWEWDASAAGQNAEFVGNVYLLANSVSTNQQSETYFSEGVSSTNNAIRHHSWALFAVTAETQYTIVAHHDSSNNGGTQSFGEVQARARLITTAQMSS